MRGRNGKPGSFVKVHCAQCGGDIKELERKKRHLTLEVEVLKGLKEAHDRAANLAFERYERAAAGEKP